MRATAFLLLALLAPQAAAQVEFLKLAIDPFDGLVEPLKGPITTDVLVEVTCPAQAAQDAQVDLSVVRAPEWASVLVSPAQMQVAASRCQTGPAHERATLIVTATDQAPALRPVAIALHASYAHAPTPSTAEAHVEVTAAYFALLDVQLREAIQTAPPDTDVRFLLHLVNHGNAATRVTIEPTRAEGGLTLLPVPPVELGSLQAGDPQSARDVELVVRTPPADGVMNQVGTVDLRIVGASASHPEMAGDEAHVSLLVTTRSASPIPGPSPLSLLALAPALALGVSRRR